MSLFTTFTKWKLRWAVLSGIFTLIVLPIVRLVFKRKSPGKSVKTDNREVIDVKAEEIKK